MGRSRRVSRCCLFLLATMLVLGAASTASAQLPPPRYTLRPGLNLTGNIALPGAVLSARNNGSGNGLYGISTALGASGVRGVGLNDSTGVSARSDGGFGVLAETLTGTAMEATASASGYGLWAQCGALGPGPLVPQGTAVTGMGYIGVFGQSATGAGLYAYSDSGTAAVFESSHGNALEAWSTGPNIAYFSRLTGADPAVIIQNNGPGTSLLVTDSSYAHPAFKVEPSGDVWASGSVSLPSGIVDAQGVQTSGGMSAQSLTVRDDVNASGVRAGSVWATGDMYARAFIPTGADFAEPFALARGKSHPGTVLALCPDVPNAVVAASTPYATTVVGVHSTQPGFMGGGSGASKKGAIPVALLGVVPCQVSAENGAIAPADLLVTSRTPGYAMKGTDRSRMLGAVLGKALEPLTKGKGTINVLLCAR